MAQIQRSMEQTAPDDDRLVAESLQGSQIAFQLLVERYQDRIFRLIRGYVREPAEIEDLAQDTFLKAYKRLESFQHQSSFYTWIYRIAINTVLDHIKRRGRSPVQAVEDLEVLSVNPGQRLPAPAANLEREEISAITQSVLEEIPEIFRTVLILREFEELAYQDIADMLGISIGTVESRLFRARARFKEKLLQKHPEFGAEL
ncbi:MAG: sigma-70 family RNA polymerase sigma factor [Planctomycetia bacterium]